MLNIIISNKIKKLHQPRQNQLKSWIKHSINGDYQIIAIDLQIVDIAQSQQLNKEYRDKDYPTNVISLEYLESRDDFGMLMGEIILCDEVIVKEAIASNKPIEMHYAHMVVHGMLHLQGYDHQNDQDQEEMENLEIAIMQKLGFDNPYLEKYCETN